MHIFTMVSYFLRWTLLKFFSSIPDEQSQQKVRRLDRITCAVINTSNEVKCPLQWEFWIKLLFSENFRKCPCWKHCKYKEWVSFFLGSWGMNRSAEQTNHPRTASRFTRFVCPALRFIPHEPRKKDTHSLKLYCRYLYTRPCMINHIWGLKQLWLQVNGHAWFHLQRLRWPIRNGEGAKNSKWKYVSSGIRTHTRQSSTGMLQRLRPLGHAG